MSTVAAPTSFAPVEAKMEAAGLSEAAIAAFKLNFDALASGATGLVSEREEGRKRCARSRVLWTLAGRAGGGGGP